MGPPSPAGGGGVPKKVENVEKVEQFRVLEAHMWNEVKSGTVTQFGGPHVDSCPQMWILAKSPGCQTQINHLRPNPWALGIRVGGGLGLRD